MNTFFSYIQAFPPEVQNIMHELRNTILQLAPNSIESISYAMPTFKLNGKPLIYFAAYKNHIGIYALPATHTQFKEELKSYKQGKGSVQFPLNKPFPMDLIVKMVSFRLQQIQV